MFSCIIYPMKLIVGLGNPGKEYENNRHNVGFILADRLIEYLHNQEQIPIQHETKFDCIFARVQLETEAFIVSKPQTHMNRSGQAVSQIMQYYKVPLENLYIAHDDLDILLGKYKIQKGTGPKLHNGITSIESVLGTKDFCRVRIGVENRSEENRIPGEAYVLQDFTEEEQEIINNTVDKIVSWLVR